MQAIQPHGSVAERSIVISCQVSRGFVGQSDYSRVYPMSGEWYHINQINLSTTAAGGFISQLEITVTLQLRNHQSARGSIGRWELELAPSVSQRVRSIRIPYRRPIQTRPEPLQIHFLAPHAIPSRHPRVLMHAHTEQRVQCLSERLE